MLGLDSLREISNIFDGDVGSFYVYKKGSELVEFFNSNFGSNDTYGIGFPSRWIYVKDKLVELLNNHQIDNFFNIILSKSYLIQEQALSEVDASEKIERIHAEFNRIIHRDLCKLLRINGQYRLVKENTDLKPIGNGGFANVYRQSSTGLVVKKLKDDLLKDSAIRSRFKREYNIIKSLQDIFGIIKVYTFDEASCSYTMDYAETTLDNYIRTSDVPDDTKLNYIRQILYCMKEVHKRNVIHRDLSANNIFIVSGMIKIADFGLGKDLNVVTSHQTMHTNAVGQYSYCAPEQFMKLRSADKRSDVFSLGCVINFIMTGNPKDSHHIYRSITEKATALDAAYRYADAGQLSNAFEKLVAYKQTSKNQTRIDEKITKKILDDEIASYIYELKAEEISAAILKYKQVFVDVLLKFMKINDGHALYIMQCIKDSYQEICYGKAFETYDPFAYFAYLVLCNRFPYLANEMAAHILRDIAKDVNRFYAQNLIEKLKSTDLEPMIEEILES